MFGMELDSCCYALKVVVRNYWTGTTKDNVLFFDFWKKRAQIFWACYNMEDFLRSPSKSG